MSDLIATPPREASRVSRPVPAVPTGRESRSAAAVRRPDPLYHLVILALSAAVLFLAAVLTVRSQAQVLIPLTSLPLPELCLTRRWFAFGCPGCGMTRCFISLARGDLAAAWSYNPAGPLLFATVVAQLPLRTAQLVRIRRGLPELTWGFVPQVLLGTIAAVMISQWLLRLCGVSW